MGGLVNAYVHVAVKRGTEQSVATQIRAMKEVTEVRVTGGLYEVLLRAPCLKHGASRSDYDTDSAD